MSIKKLPFVPAGDTTTIPGELLSNNAFCKAIIAILVNREQTSAVHISQKEFDEIANLVLVEGFDHAGNLLLTIGRKIDD